MIVNTYNIFGNEVKVTMMEGDKQVCYVRVMVWVSK